MERFTQNLSLFSNLKELMNQKFQNQISLKKSRKMLVMKNNFTQQTANKLIMIQMIPSEMLNSRFLKIKNLDRIKSKRYKRIQQSHGSSMQQKTQYIPHEWSILRDWFEKHTKSLTKFLSFMRAWGKLTSVQTPFLL